LAILLFAGLYIHGTTEPTPKLRTVAQQSVAYQAGLRGGELVTAVNGEPIQIWSDLRWKLMQAALEKSSIKLDVQHLNTGPSGGNILDTIILPLESIKPKDLEGDFLGKLGISLARPQAVLGKVMQDGPAMKAGLRERDLITGVNGAVIIDSLELIEKVRASPGQKLDIAVIRDEQKFLLEVTSEQQEIKGKTFGLIKVEVPVTPEMILATSTPFVALAKGAQKTWDISVLTLKMLGKMLVGQVSWKNITGPIAIADYAGQTARGGAISYLSFIAFISISLGVMNLLPIPVLDGGLLLYYSVEVLTGRPFPQRLEEIAGRASIGILLTLISVAMFNDIARLIF
ncbi:MAG: RIP metalloprotease RseP, partial [Glaciimonas sp.]|nr:RIP metalloprotease RseP [Glaciimonas sp.]